MQVSFVGKKANLLEKKNKVQMQWRNCLLIAGLTQRSISKDSFRQCPSLLSAEERKCSTGVNLTE